MCNVEPATLTDAQRIFLNINGYVHLRGIFSEADCNDFRQTAQRMKASSTYPRIDSDHQSVLYGPAWFDRRILQIAMGPRLRPLAEDVVGGRSRLEENEFLITAPRAGDQGMGSLRWHRGLAPDYGSFERQGNYHCLLTKVIIYLTDIEQDQRTLVMPGSHKLMMSVDRLAGMADPSLVRAIEARMGDVLLFCETLVHSSPAAPPATERVLLVIAYSAPFMRTWCPDTDPPDTLVYDVCDEEQAFIYGRDRYNFTRDDR